MLRVKTWILSLKNSRRKEKGRKRNADHQVSLYSAGGWRGQSGCRKFLNLLLETLAEYEKVSGQLVNKHKSCVILAPDAQPEEITRVENIAGMQHKELPIKYPGCPLYVGRKKISIFSDMISKILSRITGWHAKLLSTGGRAILIRHVLLALPIHILAAVHPPKGVINQIEKMITRFFWGSTDDKKRVHWASWDNLCFPYDEGGANFRKLLDTCNAFTAKQWWNFRTGHSLWKRFLMSKYCQRVHPLVKKRQSGQSQSWTAMCKVKKVVDKHIMWKVGRGDIAFWFDNWTNLGPLYSLLPEGSRPKNLKISEMLVNEQWKWEGWDILLPQNVLLKINSIKITLTPNIPDKPIWRVDNTGVFSVSSACHLFRRKRQKTWINSMTWQKGVPFKMSFIVWRALRDKIPTDSRIIKMGISIPSRCSCCRSPGIETIDHLFSNGTIAQDLWKIVCGPLGIIYTDMQFRQLLINWWSYKVKNPVHAYIARCLPIIVSWEIWKARCNAKYDSVRPNVKRSLSLISFSIAQLVNFQFHKIKLEPCWENIAQLLTSSIQFKKSILVQWTRPLASFVKLNTDGSCKDGICGGGGVLRNSAGGLIYAFSLVLGPGTSNWAEGYALWFGINWCVTNGYQCIIAESDSKLLVDCVNGINNIPWRISTEVQELKQAMSQQGFLLKHCFRESNQVADKLASLSHKSTQSQEYKNFADLPSQVKGLLNIDRWRLPVFRKSKKNNSNITFEPPGP